MTVKFHWGGGGRFNPVGKGTEKAKPTITGRGIKGFSCEGYEYYSYDF
jgi:hypothetical protein